MSMLRVSSVIHRQKQEIEKMDDHNNSKAILDIINVLSSPTCELKSWIAANDYCEHPTGDFGRVERRPTGYRTFTIKYYIPPVGEDVDDEPESEATDPNPEGPPNTEFSESDGVDPLAEGVAKAIDFIAKVDKIRRGQRGDFVSVLRDYLKQFERKD